MERIDAWERTTAQFFPLPIVNLVREGMVTHLKGVIGSETGAPMDVAAIRNKIHEISNKPRANDHSQYVLDSVVRELKWVLNDDDEGAFETVAWEILTSELHDAECQMKRDGPDLVLEGTGHPPDFTHRGRTFRFWLRFKNGRFEDKRTSTLPIEVIWILYPATSGLILAAQDDTLSGILEFSGDAYEFRIWDHTVPGPEVSSAQ